MDDGEGNREMAYQEDIASEIPEADALEQATSARLEDDGADGVRSLDDEAPEWDAQEQLRVVELDDDYR